MIDYSNADEDVPSPIDLRSESDARAWANAADRIRPWREQFRARFAELVSELPPGAHVLELGAGPGLLAERILAGFTEVRVDREHEGLYLVVARSSR